MNGHELITSLNHTLDVSIPENTSIAQLREWLSSYLNQLIEQDFQKLIFLLYRIDVDEEKMKNVLAKNPGQDAGPILADLIMERQLQKIKTRQQFSRGSGEKEW